MRSPLRRAMKSSTTCLTPSRRLSVLPSAVRKSLCSIEPEISTARIRSRAETSCVTGSPTHCGRASAATISSHTSTATTICTARLRSTTAPGCGVCRSPARAVQRTASAPTPGARDTAAAATVPGAAAAAARTPRAMRTQSWCALIQRRTRSSKRAQSRARRHRDRRRARRTAPPGPREKSCPP